jgi:predicted Zn-dependent protease
VFICFSFAGGFVWKKSGLQRAPKELAPATVGPAQRAEALRLFDEAVRARYEERLQGAVAVINEVRRLDSELPGIDVFIGEVALQQKDVWTLRKAADASLQRRANVAPALLLLAVEKWMGRLSEGAGEAGSAARSLLQEAAQHEPSHSAVYFFLGEVNRFLGEGAEAHRNLLSALHRQTPWGSSSLLATKVEQAAAEVAGDNTKSASEQMPDAP